MPRDAYSYLGLFATSEALQRPFVAGMIGTHAAEEGIFPRFMTFAAGHQDAEGVRMLLDGFVYAEEKCT